MNEVCGVCGAKPLVLSWTRYWMTTRGPMIVCDRCYQRLEVGELRTGLDYGGIIDMVLPSSSSSSRDARARKVKP